MAKIVGIIGSAHGKLGNTVMAVRRGVQIARVYQPNVSNPKSARQQYSRAKMTLAVRTLRPFAQALRAGWSLSNPTYEFQKGVSIAIPVENDVIQEQQGELVVDAANLADCLSADLLPQVIYDNLNFTTADTVALTVITNTSLFQDNGGNAINAGVVVSVLNEITGEVVTVGSVLDNRAEQTIVNVKVPRSWSGVGVKVYAFCKQIPDAVNGIAVENQPWRYPAKTTKGFYVGTGTVA